MHYTDKVIQIRKIMLSKINERKEKGMSEKWRKREKYEYWNYPGNTPLLIFWMRKCGSFYFYHYTFSILLRFYLFLFSHLFTYLSIYLYMLGLQRACGAQRTACRSHFSPFILWVPGIKLRASVLVTSTLTNWTILLTQLFRLLISKIILLCSLRHGNLGSLHWKSNRAVQDRGRVMSAFKFSAW